MITDWLKKEYIQLDVASKTAEEAIKIAASPLIYAHKIKPDYVNEILQNLKESGPYFVLMPEIAIPHAQTQHNVLENALGLTVLKEPVDFKSNNGPVKFIFTFAAPPKVKVIYKP